MSILRMRPIVPSFYYLKCSRLPLMMYPFYRQRGVENNKRETGEQVDRAQPENGDVTNVYTSLHTSGFGHI